jgi:hypothetical protein
VVVSLQELGEAGGVESVHAKESGATGHFVPGCVGIKHGGQTYSTYFMDEFVFV